MLEVHLVLKSPSFSLVFAGVVGSFFPVLFLFKFNTVFAKDAIENLSEGNSGHNPRFLRSP